MLYLHLLFHLLPLCSDSTPEAADSRKKLPTNKPAEKAALPIEEEGTVVKASELDIIKHLQKQDLSDLITPVQPITAEKINQFVKLLCTDCDITPSEAMTAFFLLVLGGAANKGCPDSLSITLRTDKGARAISKGELLTVIQKVFQNKYIRRLAEYLAPPISEFAEKYRLGGDLASQLVNKINLSVDEPLSIVEKAWISSFNQKNPDCIDRVPRLAKILNKDYYDKFIVATKNNVNANKGKKRSTPRKPGPGKGQGPSSSKKKK